MIRLSILFISLFFFFACDRVENPIPQNSGAYDISLYPGNYATDYNYPSFGTNSNTNLNVLLEDYTGHQCGNCPIAGTNAKNIEAANNGRVIVVSEHAGAGGISQYQRIHVPGEPEYPKYSRNFTNEAGLAYATTITGIPGNPYGMINRKIFSGATTPWVSNSQWANRVNTVLQENNLRADLQMEVNYFPQTHALFVHVESEAKTNLSGNYNLFLYAVAKDVIDWQKDYTVFPNDVEFYEHHNVHLGNINGTWGQPVFEGTVTANTKVRKDYTYVIPEAFRGLDYAVVGFIADANTYEILQVIKVEP